MPSVRSHIVRRSGMAFVRSTRAATTAVNPDTDPRTYDVRPYRNAIERLARATVVPPGFEIEQVDSAGVRGEWVRASGADRRRALLYVHGGAYIICSPRTHRTLTLSLSRRTGASVFAVEYRLAPEDPYPAAEQDVLRAYSWLIDDVGIAPERLAIGGDSAGGGLTFSALVAAREAGLPLAAAAFGLSPWTDLAMTGDSIRERANRDPWIPTNLMHLPAIAYAGHYPQDHPGVSPFYADVKGLPPTLIHVGSEEVLFDDGRRMVQRLREAGVDASFGVWDGMWHAFQAFPGTPERGRALREIAGFVNRHTLQTS